MGELIDLSEISYDHLLRLYCQLKLLGTDGMLANFESLGYSFDALENIKLKPLTFDEESADMLTLYNSEASIPLRDLAEKLGKGLNTKCLLEKFLDSIFTRKNLDVKLGRLLREFSLKLEDVNNVKEFLMNSANATVKSLFDKFLFVPCELEIILAVLFSKVDSDLLCGQYETFSNLTPSFEINDEDLSVLLEEFNKSRQLFDDEMKKEHIDIERELDQTLNKCDDVDLSVREIDADINNMTADIETIIKHENFSIRAMCLKERCSIDDNTSPESFISPKKFRLLDLMDVSHGPMTEIQNQNFPIDDSLNEVEQLTQVCQHPLLNQVMPSSMPQLRVNDQCFAKDNSKNYWMDAKVLKIGLNDVLVSFGQGGAGNVHKSNVAFYTFPTWILSVGDRVVAFYQRSNQNSIGLWIGGIVGEQPSPARNGNRYLVLFDNGEAQYIDYRHIRRVYGPSNPGYLDIADEQMRIFVMDYVKKYPERAVVRLKKDQTVKVEFQGRWLKTRVTDIDGMMVQVYFDDGHFEWLYRGNKRLEPIHSQEVNVQANIQSGRRYRRSNRPFAPVVEYVSDDEGAEEEDIQSTMAAGNSQSSNNVQVAKKSTGPRPRSHKYDDVLAICSQEDEEFELVEERLPCPDFLQRVFSRHNCSPFCLTYEDDPIKHKGKNPFSIPMRVGWERIISQTHANGESNRTRKIVIYSAPCCQRLRTMNEIASYLRRTDSKLTVDLFCFDPNVRPFSRIRMKKPMYYDKDFTKGKEAVPIECVNCVSTEAPQKLNYEPRRYTSDRSVNLSLAYEFLSGCDCEGTCSNKAKCKCQQLTINQTLVMTDKPDYRAGYENRLLPRGVVYTGIFECNPRCKCNSRCSNRVVQNPLMSVLQLFKTRNRGWGVRTLYDIPKGAFIAIYAGNVLSDHVANELGKTQGDEYFAELDLIQLSEQLKEGFEAEVVPPDDDEVNSEDGSEENSCGSVRAQTQDSDNIPDVKTEGDEDVVILTDDSSTIDKKLSARRASETNNSVPTSLKRWSMADYIGEDKVYTLDAKVSGNIGRYLNHSCSPNVFVQNVFVDTHDLSLPWVAFFASQRIKAGAELVWDYAYTVGSVPGKEIKCYCGSTNCRRRLL